MERDEENLKFRLDCFEGPLDLLLHLIQRQEVEIFDLVLERLTAQLLDKVKSADFLIDEGAESIWLIATLAHLKSRKLLPAHESTEAEEDAIDPRLELMQHLVEYQRYKQAALFLEKRESDQSAYFAREVAAIPEKKTYLEEIPLSELTGLLSTILANAKARSSMGIVAKEEWQVSDQLEAVKQRARLGEKIALLSLFTEDKCREELVVLFLAILELMKMQVIELVKENETVYIKNKHV